ncbi:hypothetical protein Dimus_002112 [Dionaea muscipula]
MDSNSNPPPQENNEAKAVFRKPSNDVANRKYRRRSPTSSSSSDGSPMREPSGSPVSLKEDAKLSSYQTRKDDKSDARGSRGQQHHSSDSYRYSSRSSHLSSRHDDNRKDGKHTDEDDKYSRLSSRSSRDHRDSNRSDYRDRDADYKRSRDHYRDGEKYSRDKSDITAHPSRDKDREAPSEEYRKYRYKESSSDRRHGKSSTEEDNHDREYHDEKRDRRSSRDNRIHRIFSYGESREHRGDATSKKDGHGYHIKETSKNEPRAFGSRDDKKKGVEQDIDKTKLHAVESGERIEKGSGLVKESEESVAKKPKLFSFDKDNAQRKEDSKQVGQPIGKVSAGQALVNSSETAVNVDAAKIAAMRAAELVNKNLIGTGVMTADQKKKLLWGNKKTNTSEESSHRWDTALFSDRERQEKFNKLMSLRLPWYVWPIVGCKRRCESGTEKQRPRYRSPSGREAERTSVGSGEAVYSRTSSKRWTHRRLRPLVFNLELMFIQTSLSATTYSCLTVFMFVSSSSNWDLHLLCSVGLN